MRYSSINRLFAFAIVVLSASVAHAQVTWTWTGTAANANWDTPGAFANAGVPQTLGSNFNQAFVFSGTNLLSSTNTLTGGTATSITFSGSTSVSPAGAFTLSGSAITLAGNIGFDSAPASSLTQTINLDIALAGGVANPRFANPLTNATIVLNGVISGTPGFGKAQNTPGTLVLSNTANSFRGPLNIGSGVLSVASVADSGVNSTIGSGTAIVFGYFSGQTSTLTYTGATGGSTNRALIISSSNNITQTINSNGANGGSGLVFTGSLTHATRSGSTTTLTIGGTNTDANEIRTVLANNASGGVLAVTKSGTGNWILSGANSYSGATSISAGALTIQNASALGSTTGTTTVSSGAALRLQGGIAVGAEPLRVAGTGISTTGALRNMSGTNSFAGPITLTAATRVNSDADELTLSGPIGGAFGMTFGGAGATNVSGTIATGAASLTKDGAGRLTLSAANSYTGLTTISNGTLAYGVSDAIFDGGISVNGAAATLDIGEFADTVGAVTLTSGRIIGTTGVLTGTSYTLSSGTVSAILGGSGAVSKTGAGTVVLNGANTLTGVTDIQGGTLSVTPVALATSSQINVGVNGSGGLNLFADDALATFTMANDASLFVGGTSTIGTLGFQLGSAATTYDTIVLQGAGTVMVGDGGGRIVVSGTTGFGSGRYTLLSGPNVITNASAFQVDAANSTPGYLYLLDSTTDPTQLVLTVGQAFNDLWWDGTVDSSWSTLSGSASNWSSTADGLTDAGSLPASITTVRFSAANVGAADVNTTIGYAAAIAGLDIGNTGASTLSIAPGTGGSLTTGTGGITLQAGGPTTTITAPVTLGTSQTWSVADAATLTLGSTVAGDGQTLTKTGAGTLVFSGTHANTFSGTTTLAEGTLRVENSDAGALGTTALQLNAGQLQLAGDASLSLSRNTAIGGDATIVTSRMSAGDGVTATLGTLSIGANTLTVATGTLATSGTQGLTFGAVTLTGNPTFALTNNAPGATLLLTTGAMTTGGFTPTFTGSGNFIATGAISGTGGVTWSSNGVYVANRSHSFTGPLTINAGTVRASTSAGALGAGTLVLNSGTLDIASDTALNFNRPTTVGNATIITERTTSGAGVVTGTFGTLTIGSGTLTITSSPLTTSGTQGVRFTAVILTGGNPTFLLDNNTSNARLQLFTTGFNDLAGNTPTFTGSGDFQPAAMKGNGGVTWSSTGIFFTNVNHTFNGALTITSGSVRTGSNEAALGQGTLALNGGTVDLVSTAGSVYGRNTTVGGNATIITQKNGGGAGITNTLGTLAIGAQTLTVASSSLTTSGTQGLTFGAVTLSGNPTFNVDNNTAGASLLLTLGALGGADRTVTKAGSGTLLLSSSATAATGLQVSVTGGALAVGNGNAFGDSAAGTTVASGAELRLNPASGSIAVAAQPLSIAGQGITSGGALRSVSGSNTWQGMVTLTGNATIGAASGTRLTIDVASGNAIEATDFNLTFDGAGTTEVLDPISLGTGGLAQIGSGTTILGGSSTFSGPLSIAQGTLRIGGAGQLVGTPGAYASTITGSAGTVFDYASSADSTLTGAISGGLVLVKTGAGTLTISGSNAYSGGTQVNGGTLVTGDPSAYGTGSVTIASGGTLDLNNLSIPNAIASGRGTIINAANFSGTSTVSGSTSYTGNVGGSVVVANGGAASFSGTVASLTINTGGRATLLNDASLPQASLTNDGVLAVNQSFDSSLSTAIFGNGGVEKAGTGVLALWAASTYTGPTTVSAGGLVVNGSIASNVSVAAGATLGGSGSVGAISGAGVVGPGNSPGILTATSVTPAGGLSFAFEFTQAAPNYGSPTASGNDLLWLTAGTPFTSALDAANIVNIYVTQAAVELGTLTGGFYTADTVEFLGSISGASFNYYVQAAGGPVTYGGQTYQSLAVYDPAKSVTISTIAANGGRVMQMVVVPEPGAAALAAIGVVLAGWRLARRRAE